MAERINSVLQCVATACEMKIAQEERNEAVQERDIAVLESRAADIWQRKG